MDGRTPADDPNFGESFAVAINTAASGAVLLSDLAVLGKILRAKSEAVTQGCITLEDDVARHATKARIVKRASAALAAWDKAQGTCDVSVEAQDTIAKGRPLSEALRKCVAAEALPHILRLEAVLAAGRMGEPDEGQDDAL